MPSGWHYMAKKSVNLVYLERSKTMFHRVRDRPETW